MGKEKQQISAKRQRFKDWDGTQVGCRRRDNCVIDSKFASTFRRAQ